MPLADSWRVPVRQLFGFNIDLHEASGYMNRLIMWYTLEHTRLKVDLH
jgi:hypothetical protein